MALIRTLTQGEMQRYRTHDPIDATFYLHEFDGRRMIQLNMNGRTEAREFPDKVSQSIQLDEDSAQKLFDILRDHFGFE